MVLRYLLCHLATMMNRRELICALGAGAIITAEGLWIPGQKLISIPKKHLIGLHRDYISLVDDATGRILCRVIRGPAGVDIARGIARVAFPEITWGTGVATGIYVGKHRVLDVNNPMSTFPGLSVIATIKDLRRGGIVHLVGDRHD